MNEIIVNVYNDEVNVGVEDIIETVTIVITENAGVPSDAPIETISKNGTPLPITDKNVDITVPTKTSELEKDDVYTKTEINNKLSTVYKYKGSVLTYDLLPTDAENADVYNVEENGVNYAWVQATESWDSLGGLIGLATLTENGLLSKEDFAKLQNLSGINTGDETQSTIGALVEATELTEITDTSKIATSNGGVLNWFSGLRIKNYLTGFFAKLSGGNYFTGIQRIQQYLVFGSVINNYDDRLESGGAGFSIVGFTNGIRAIFRATDVSGFRCRPDDSYDAFNVLGSGNINKYRGKYEFNAVAPNADTINDRRTSNQSGVKIEEICTVASGTKGGGTWKKNIGISEFGGQMIGLINKTGAPSVKGTLVSCSNTTDNAFSVETSEFDTIGVVYESGIADGAECWVVISGIAQVLLVDGTASTRGYWTYADAVDGRANATLPLPSGGTIQELQNHFKEIGHCLESKTAGTNVLAKVMLHFN